MMNKNIFRFLMLVIFCNLFIAGCKKWEDHNELTDPMTGKDLFLRISENPDLSKFAELLTKSGYDKIISSSKTYTVFAPTNAALATIDPTIVSDDAKLKMFVGNHITNQLQQTVSATSQVRIQMVNGKYNNLSGTMLEDATITTADQFAKNGFVHIINKMVPALPNAWEFIQSSPLVPVKQKNFLLSLIDSTGNNSFLRNVHDLRDEIKQYTFFVLTDTAWDSEVNKFKPYFATGTTDSTSNLSGYEVVRDLAVEGVYLPGSIPDTILSKFNVKVGIDKSAIVQTVKVSNGIVYIMSKVDVNTKDKFQEYLIQAEDYHFSRIDRRNNTYFRDKFNTATGSDFRDVLVFNHGVPQFYLGYRLNNVPSIKYKAYWVALHDNVNNYAGNFRQRLGIGSPVSTLLPLITVTPNVYSEIYLGEFTLDKFSPELNIYLTADNTTVANTNMITADYIRLVPVL